MEVEAGEWNCRVGKKNTPGDKLSPDSHRSPSYSWDESLKQWQLAIPWSSCRLASADSDRLRPHLQS